jgi:polygalacturonase
VVLPINTDREARIFNFADLGVVGDAAEYAPAVAAAIRAAADEAGGEADDDGEVGTGGESEGEGEVAR